MEKPALQPLPFARPEFDEETIALVGDVFRSHWVASGPHVLAFESELSAYFGGRPTRVLTSATAAMEVALQLCDIGPGDEVILPAQTFFAAGNMVLRVGATLVFVDVDLHTRNMDLTQTAAAITPRTKALLPTHFNGLPMEMDKLYALAKQHKLRVIEDAALAVGSSWQNKRIGSIGDLVVFSFHPNKNITSIEGGAIVLDSVEEAKRIEILRFHGIVRKPDYTRDIAEVGGKFNLSDVSAAVGRKQLAKLDAFCAKRQQLVARYFEKWPRDVNALLPAQAPKGEEAGHSWNMWCPLIPFKALGTSRKEFIDTMKARGIAVGISYEVLHLATAFLHLGHKPGDFPHSEHIGEETVSLPLFTQMTLDDVDRVCATVSEILVGPQ
jgi:dTDP-4-amino-4,6-dideoxygalactose transaminase